MDITTRRRSAISTILAIVLAVESVSAVAAAAGVSARQAGPVDPAGSDPGAAVVVRAPLAIVQDPQRLVVDAVSPASVGPVAAPVSADAPVLPPSAATKAPLRTPEVKHEYKAVKPGTGGSGKGGDKASPASYRGRNHVWIPSLGINRSVSFFPCDRSRPPDNHVYRWGCAGANNVYLMGHAHSVFKPLHNAYTSGRLRKGMKVWYADSRGKVRVYSVRWWKLTAPTTSAKWAWAAQRAPSMTLQTCVGRNSQYRLMVRLVEVGH